MRDEDQTNEQPISGRTDSRLQFAECVPLERNLQSNKETLQQSAELYRQLFELESDALFLIDSSTGSIIEVNAAAEALYGFNRYELLQKKNTDLSAQPDETSRATREERLQVPLRFHKKKDGTVFPVEITASHFVLSWRQVHLAAIRDITERNRAEEALRESEEKFRLAFRTSPDSINLNRLSDGMYLDINEGFTKIMGYAREEVIGKASLELNIWHNPKDRGRLVEALKSEGFVENLEARFCGKDGKVRFGLMSARLLRINQEDVILSITRDITERKQAEEEKKKLEAQLFHAQKLESVGRLAGGVAHDFNNMLGVILGHTEMALDLVDPAQPLFADLQEIRKAAERSANLTRQLLAFARKQTVAPKVLDLNETVEGMLKMLRRLIGEDIDLSWLSGAGVWQVKMDPSQLDQILANLCVNARDAIAGVGRLTIETKNVAFDEAYCAEYAGFVPGEYVLLAVSDNGCGMDKETMDRLFEPFFTTKGVGEGTGLGLATVYGIVSQNNGFINVYSEPGQGTTFTIYLPRHRGKAGQMQKEDPVEPAGRAHETILLVEDEPAILRMTTMMLERQGYAVLSAGTPGEAIRLTEEHPGEIHLLMTDVVMPEMNGRDLAKKLLSLHPNLKRLFMSGYTANVIAHHGVLDPGINFIQKPFSMQNLAAKLREVLGVNDE